MNRYQSSSVNKRWDGKRFHRTTVYPSIPMSLTDIYIIADETDYLDSLAKKYYQDQSLWWIIAQANGIKATMKAPTGEQIRIPGNVSDILSNFFSANK